MSRLRLLFKFIRLIPKARDLEKEYQSHLQEACNLQFAHDLKRNSELDLTHKLGFIEGIDWALKRFGGFLLVASLAGILNADTGFYSTIRVTETDNSPACQVGQIKVSPNTLACNGQTATITIGGGSSGGASTLETFVGAARSSPTASITGYTGDLIGSVIGGTTFHFALNPATTDFIHNQTTAQSATFNVSSGTASEFTFTDSTGTNLILKNSAGSVITPLTITGNKNLLLGSAPAGGTGGSHSFISTDGTILGFSASGNGRDDELEVSNGGGSFFDSFSVSGRANVGSGALNANANTFDVDNQFGNGSVSIGYGKFTDSDQPTVPNGGLSVKYGISGGSLTARNVASGSSQCLHADGSGFITGTGSDCSTGGGGEFKVSLSTGTIGTLDISAQTNLAVEGMATLNGDTIGVGRVDISTGTNLAVEGMATLNGDTIGVGRVDISTGTNLAVEGMATLNGDTIGVGRVDISTGTNLAVEGAATLNGDTIGVGKIDISTGTNLAVEGMATLNGDTVGVGKVSFSTGVFGTVAAANFPALTGDVTTPGGSLATTLAASIAGDHTFTGSIILSSFSFSTATFRMGTNLRISTGTPLSFAVDGILVSSSGVNQWGFTTAGGFTFNIPPWAKLVRIRACGAGGGGGGGEGRASGTARGGGSGGGGGACQREVLDASALPPTIGFRVGAGGGGGNGGSANVGVDGSAGGNTVVYTVQGSTWIFAGGGGQGNGDLVATDASGGSGGGSCGVGATGSNTTTAGGCPQPSANVQGQGGAGAGSTTGAAGKVAEWGGGSGGAGGGTAGGFGGGGSENGGAGGGGAAGCTTLNACGNPGAGGATNNIPTLNGGGGTVGTSGTTCTAGGNGTGGNANQGGFGGGGGGSDQDSTAAACLGGNGGVCGGGGGGGGAGTSVGAKGGTGGDGCVFIQAW